MATYQIINLQTGEFSVVSLEEVAELDPHEIEWAIEEHGVCETDQFQIIELDRNLPRGGEKCDASDAGERENETDHKQPQPVFVFITQEEFEAHFACRGADPLR